MTALRTWFADRSRREQRLLLVMLALLAVTLLWAGIVLPVTDGLASARARHADAAIRLGETEARLDALRRLQGSNPRPLTGALPDLIRAEADRAGFVLASLDVQAPDRVRVSIASARPAALTAWLGHLEAMGVLVGEATLTDHGDRTVGVALTLAARGR